MRSALRAASGLSLGAVVAFLAGCAGARAGCEMSVSFSPDLNVRYATMRQSPTGLCQRDLQVGTGAIAASGDRVSVHYTGWLPNGTQFDSSRSRGPFQFTLGANEVIDGWDEGVAGMAVGGVRQIVVPPALGYGARGAGGVIPPNATLLFEIELLDIE